MSPTLLLAPVFLASGYPLAARLRSLGAAERLAVAVLAGLAVFLLTASAVNFFAPLSSWRAWLCLWPLALFALQPSLLYSLRHDLVAVLSTRKGQLAATLALASSFLLIWPELTRPELVYYDATSSHDGYFWIAGARHLQSHSYMESAAVDPDHPWANSTAALSGWRPGWGRAGAEGLLAVCASVLSLDPLHVYLPVNLALLAAWFSAVYLVARTFWLRRFNLAGVTALFAFPALFAFYRANSNLPNLLGALMGATALVAAARSLAPGPNHASWLLLLALSVHGTFFAYPEIAPFIALPGLLLLARTLRTTPPSAPAIVLALLAGLVLNPATTIRAYHGFVHAFAAARANADWVNTFARLDWPQYPPALATLSLPAAIFLGPAVCFLASVLLLAAAALALRRAHDRYGASATLAGGAVLIGYTLLTDFSYGWQKSVQFSGVFIAALLPVAAFQSGLQSSTSTRRRAVDRLLAGSVALLFGCAMVFHVLESVKWSTRRALSRDWIDLQTFAANSFRNAEIRVEPATFPMSFFHGMWATYFLPDTPLSFGPRGERNGGYLHATVTTAPPLPTDSTAAILVGRVWADTFDANSPRLFTGDTFALLSRSNQVVSLAGFHPAEGPPQTLSSGAVIELRPHTRSELQLTLVPDAPDDSSAIEWRATSDTTTVSAPAGTGPWNLVVPLTPGELHRIEFTASAADSDTPMPSLRIAALRVVTLP